MQVHSERNRSLEFVSCANFVISFSVKFRANKRYKVYDCFGNARLLS